MPLIKQSCRYSCKSIVNEVEFNSYISYIIEDELEVSTDICYFSNIFFEILLIGVTLI